jgi:hypothetical protein
MAANTRERSRNGNGRSNGRRREREEERQEEQPGFGTCFDRRKSRTNDKAPDFSTGEEPVKLDDGSEVEVAVWVRKSRSGKRYLRVHVQRPYEYDDADDLDDDEEENGRDDDDEDDVPF